MKTITIEGEEYEVPDRAQWVAMDENGEWCWYADEPRSGRVFWEQENQHHGVTYGFIVIGSSGWRETKRRI